MMKITTQKRFLFLTALLIFMALTSAVSAAELDPKTGKLKPDNTGSLYGFEESESPLNVVLINANGDEVPASEFQDAVFKDELGIEGDYALRFSSTWKEARIPLSDFANNLNGRRIEVRLWAQPKGIKLNAQLTWESNGHQLSAIHLNPTGRMTDDGWRELTSGPLDFNLAESVSLSVLKLVNDQLEFPLRGQSIAPDLASLVDGLEIINLGSAEVTNGVCRTPTEKQQCGEKGSCFLGRCVDSSFLWGAKPNSSIAVQAIDHRVYQIDIGEGVRKTRPTFETFKASMNELKQSEDGQSFWQGMQDALQTLEDGHLETPKAAAPNIPNVGFCINAGEADLLPTGQDRILPMVFNDVTLRNGLMLKKGDVIVLIDGIAPEQWVNQVRSPYFISPGDVSSRLVMQYHSLNHLIAQSGSEVEFKRCEMIGGCTAEQLETLTIDFATLIGEPYWRGELAPWMYENGFCDFRFDEGAPLHLNDKEFSEQVITQNEEGITEIQFNGFHHPASNPEWHSAFDSALVDNPSNVLIDHRFGYGGSPSGLHYILDNFIGQEDYKKMATMSWYGTLNEQSQIQSALDCNLLLPSIYECGWVWSYKQGDYVIERATQDSKLALVYGWGVSASDFMMRVLQERRANTRVFGISPMPGGYGTTAYLPNILNEYWTGRIQIQDGMFEFQQWTDFESGFGAVPDQIVFQKQSDAIRGVDSIIAAAENWLQTPVQGE